MPKFSPSWFAADQLFRRHGGWYIGAESGFSVGPFRDAEAAQTASLEIRARLTRARSRGEMIRIVRAFLDDTTRRRQGEQPRVRAGEQPRFWFRSERCFSVDGVWYVSTREGVDVGPYRTRRVAERQAVRLLERLRRHRTAEARLLVIREFVAETAAS